MVGEFSGKKRFLVFILIICGSIAFYLWSAWKDLHLDPNSIKKVVKEGPTVVVESLSMEKEISGGVWHIHAERTVRKSGNISAESLTMQGNTADGNKWNVTAPSGNFDEKTSDGILYKPSGTTTGKDFTVTWSAPEVLWESTSAEWIFPKGIWAEHTRGTLTGSYARVTEDGTFYVEKGASLTWKE